MAPAPPAVVAVTLPPPPAPAAEPVPVPPAVVAATPPPPAAAAPAAPAADGAAAATSTTVVSPPAEPPPAPEGATETPGSPSPIGIGEAALLSAGVLALLASRRRSRLRRSQPRARVPEPPPEAVAAERKLRVVDAGERLLRVDIAVRAAAASLVDGAVAHRRSWSVGADGAVELVADARRAARPVGGRAATRWTLPGATPVELLADAARSVGAPCAALAQLGVTADGRDVLVDLEALGVLAVDADPAAADAVVQGVAATLAASIFAEVASLDRRRRSTAPRSSGTATPTSWRPSTSALELAATLVGTTAVAAARQSTFVLRARHTSGEAWEPAVVLVGSGAAGDVPRQLAAAAVGAARSGPGRRCRRRPTRRGPALRTTGAGRSSRSASSWCRSGSAARSSPSCDAVLAAADAPLEEADDDDRRRGPTSPRRWTWTSRRSPTVGR